MAGKTAAGALDGVRVLDLTSVFLGPYCTQLLGDMGADVIKIEPPGGDTTRYLGPSRSRGMGGTFLNVNRNKRSCVLDLKSPLAMETLARMVQSCDVMVHNMRPAAAARLGIDYAWARALNEKIVYCAAFGFGEGGRYAGRPAFDDSIQGISGIAGYQGLLTGSPAYCGTVVADKVTGAMAANAIVAALFARERTGLGQSIDVPMFETMVAFVLAEHMTGAAFEPPLSTPVYARVVSRNRKPYETADGYLTVVPYNDKQWRKFFAAIGREDLAADPRFADMASRTVNIDALYTLLADEMRSRTTAEWIELLTANDIPNVPVTQPEELLGDPHLADVGFYRTAQHESEGEIRMTAPPVTFSQTPSDIRHLAPRLGQHTEEVLGELGFSAEEIARLAEAGVTRPRGG
ncbi:CaiB/BaiF CoA transferase family protein [Futiania mangrovi]|uniref:CoA transferase n=1 Tax=Futiania mangrovi TaxID=2959716 RepID=A0A9J6PCT2_9PROT|nr:CoA transferase [Futiania mangrovii]MCP1335467.1 CoA transferase [Futiania mangrovii]